MKNLELWEVNARDINLNSKEKFHLCYNYDGENKVKFFAVTHNLQVSNIDEFGAINWTKDISEITDSENIPVNITYISLSNQVCIALANGELITVDESGCNCELVGIFDNRLMVNTVYVLASSKYKCPLNLFYV